MDPKTPPDDTPQKQSSLPENQQNQNEDHALPDSKSSRGDEEDIKESNTLETFRAKVLKFARKSRMSPEHISLIERSFLDFFPHMHVPDHPPYATMIHRAIMELNEAGGSTEEAISHFIRKEHNDLPWAHATLLTHHLEKLCENGGVLVTGEKSYMLNTACVTINPNQIEAFNPNQIEAFNPNQICLSPVPGYSPYSSPSSSSSSSYSDYTPNAKKRQKKRTGRKYGKKRRSDRKKPESEEEFENNEAENSEETEEEEESEEYEDTSEEFRNTEEVEVTEVENRIIKYKGKHTHRTEGDKKETEEKSEFGDEHMRVVEVENQVDGAYKRGRKLARGRGRPLRGSKPKTYTGPKEGQVELIVTHNQVTKDPKRPKQRRGRIRPSKNIGFETETRPEVTEEKLLETHNQLTGVLSRPKKPKQRRGGCSPPKQIGADMNTGPREVHKEVTKAFNQATKDLKRPREKRGRGRPPKYPGTETNIGQKEAQREVINAHNQITDCMENPEQKRGRGRPPKNPGTQTNIGQKEAQRKVINAHNQITDCMEKPEQKRGRGRPSKNSGGQMVVFEVHNQTTEDGMKLKHKRIRFRGKYERKEVNKHLDHLEASVIEDMIGRMVIKSRDDGDNVCGEVSPCFPCKSCEPVMEDKTRKERKQQIQSSMGGVELFDKDDWVKHTERSQELEDMEKMLWTPVQLPQKGTEDEANPCQLHLQAFRAEKDEWTPMKEMAPAPSHVVHEEQQPECIGQGGPPGFEHVTTIASVTVPNCQHENERQQQIHIGKKQLLETEQVTPTFVEMLQSEYEHMLNYNLLDQPKKQSCSVSTKPTNCTGEDDRSSEGNK